MKNKDSETLQCLKFIGNPCHRLLVIICQECNKIFDVLIPVIFTE